MAHAPAIELDGDIEEARWDERAPRVQTDVPILVAGNFAEPLDWLLEMARAKKLDLQKMPVGGLIQSFVETMEAAFAAPGAGEPRLERWGEWVVMAATLTLLRSALLLPADSPQSVAALREGEALRAQLIEHTAMHAAADWLGARLQLGREVLGRGRPAIVAGNRAGDVTDLLRACLSLLAVPEEVAAVWRIRAPFWPMRQARACIEERLGKMTEPIGWAALLPTVDAKQPDRNRMCREAVCSTFAASLDLAREERLTLGQAALWRDLACAKVETKATHD